MTEAERNRRERNINRIWPEGDTRDRALKNLRLEWQKNAPNTCDTPEPQCTFVACGGYALRIQR